MTSKRKFVSGEEVEGKCVLKLATKSPQCSENGPNLQRVSHFHILPDANGL